MITASFNDNVLCIIEPASVARMKAGKPLRIDVPPGTKQVAVTFVPDMLAFQNALGVPQPKAGERIETTNPPTAAEILKAYDLVKDLPEVLR